VIIPGEKQERAEQGISAHRLPYPNTDKAGSASASGPRNRSGLNVIGFANRVASCIICLEVKLIQSKTRW